MFRLAVSWLLLLFVMLSIPKALIAQELKSITVVKTTMPLQRFLEGRVEAISQATVSAQTSGLVDQVMVDIGDYVPAGTVILKLVGADQNEALNQARANWSEASANQKAVSQQFDRVEALYAKKLLSKANYDSALASYNSAKARVSNTQAALNRARQQVSYTEIKAVYGGVVSGRHVEVGEAVQPGMALMSGFDPSHLRVYVDVPQSIVSTVRKNPLINVVMNNGVAILPSKITFFPIGDIDTGTVRMRLEINTSQEGLYPGQLVKVAINVGEKERLLIPKTSMVYRSEIAGVYVLGKKRGDLVPLLRQVRIGNHYGDKLEILSGLMVNEIILTDPLKAGIIATKDSVKEEQ